MIAVTKYVDVATTAALVRTGQPMIGESRPQVLWQKADALANEDIAGKIQWHLIGHLQRNKVKQIIPYSSMIHSVDSIRLLRTIDVVSSELGRVTNCLLQVNISGETAKHGFQPEAIESALQAATGLASVNICGLMGMAGLSGGERENRSEFARLRDLRDKHSDGNCGNIQLRELSMGMSGDFESAIAEGSTMVRIGSILFEGIDLGH